MSENLRAAQMSTPVDAISRWLEIAIERGASDLHLLTGYPPTIRLHGELAEIEDSELDQEFLDTGLRSFCDEATWASFKKSKNVDFALEHEFSMGLRRCRANYFVAGTSQGVCFRIIPAKIPTFEWTGFPRELAHRLAHLRNGLVLVSGMTGAGKTTTLAMIVNLLNKEGGYRIITAEDPIEYVFARERNSIVSQREVGCDIASFADGLRYGLRQDPDVILVGEIRDRETAQMALSAAETGHLVLSTLHTRDAKGAISRFADLFPQSSQPEVRAQLAMSLRAVVSQHLLHSSFEDKRQLALEILFNNHPIASAIRMGKLESIDTGITTGRSDGMISLDESIKRLLQDGSISRETAGQFISDKSTLNR